MLPLIKFDGIRKHRASPDCLRSQYPVRVIMVLIYFINNDMLCHFLIFEAPSN